MEELTIEHRACIVAMRKRGESVAKIATLIPCSKGTVSKTLKQEREHNTLQSLPRTRRPKKLRNQKNNVLFLILKDFIVRLSLY